MEKFRYKGTYCNEGFVSQLWEISKHVLWIWVQRESCHHFFWWFQNLNIQCVFWIKHRNVNIQPCGKSLKYHTCTTYTCAELLTFNRNGCVYLNPQLVTYIKSGLQWTSKSAPRNEHEDLTASYIWTSWVWIWANQPIHIRSLLDA
jgi:hypothetical protein